MDHQVKVPSPCTSTCYPYIFTNANYPLQSETTWKGLSWFSLRIEKATLVSFCFPLASLKIYECLLTIYDLLVIICVVNYSLSKIFGFCFLFFFLFFWGAGWRECLFGLGLLSNILEYLRPIPVSISKLKEQGRIFYMRWRLIWNMKGC